jgi:hypothetical protein
MDENEVIDQSPLAQVAQASAQQSPIAKPTVAATAQPSEYEKAITEYRRQQQQLIERQKELIDSLNVRIQPSDYLSAMAQGFGDPRNLSFASGIAGAAGNVSAIQAAEQKRAQELAKMKLELGMQELGMQKENIELAKTQQLSSALTGLLSGRASPESAAAAGITKEQASLVANMPAEYKGMIIAQLQTGDVKGAIQELQKYMLEQTKEPEKIKELRYYMSQLQSPAARSAAQQLAANNFFLGSPADRSKAILDIRKAIDEGIIPARDGNILIQGMTNLGGQSEVATPPASAATPAAAAPAGFPRISPEEQAERDRVSAGVRAREQTGEGIPTSTIVGNTSGISPKQQRDILAKGAEVSATKRAEAAEGRRESLEQRAENATRVITDANAVYDFATKQPAAFGIISKPGISNALLTLAQNGIRVGNFTVGLNDVQDAIRKAGGTQADIDAAAAVAQIAVQTSLDLAAGVKGAVSNYEQGLFQQASFSPNDSPAVLKYKAELARARGEFDKFIWNKYLQFEGAGGRNITDFKQTPEYKNYVNQYDSALRKIRGTYFR